MTPIRRGTARRLGLTQPSCITLDIYPDLSALQNLGRAIFPDLKAWHQQVEAQQKAVAAVFQRMADNMAAARADVKETS